MCELAIVARAANGAGSGRPDSVDKGALGREVADG
jgi:hypothetical protein